LSGAPVSGRSTIPRGAVRGVSFDYGNVLGALDLEEMARRIGRPDRAADMRAALGAAHAEHDREIARGAGHEQGWRAYVRVLVEASGAPAVDSTIDALWAAQPTHNLWRAIPLPHGARDLLARLDAKGVPLALTTNSEGRARELIAEVGLARPFRAVLDSGVLGFAKPDPRIFARAADALGVPISALVHVGDSERADVEGALRAGAFAIRFDGLVPGASGEPTAAHARASDYGQLAALLADALAR
jgi:putative hydrolase of the HAD superfamily